MPNHDNDNNEGCKQHWRPTTTLASTQTTTTTPGRQENLFISVYLTTNVDRGMEFKKIGTETFEYNQVLKY